MFENDQTFFPGGEKSGKIWPGHKWHGCDHHPGELQLVVLSYPCSWCSKERTIFVVEYCCCWILLLLNIAVVVLSLSGAEKTGLSFPMLSYLVAGAQQRGLPAPAGQLSERCSPHWEHSARLQPRRLGRADKHSCQVWEFITSWCLLDVQRFDVSGLSATSGSELDWSWSHNCQGDQAHAQAHGSLVVLLIMRLIMLMIVVQDMLISGGSSSQWWFKCFTHSHCRLIRTHFQVSYKYKNSTIEEAEKRHAKR